MRSIEITNILVSVQVRPFDKSLLKIDQKTFLAFSELSGFQNVNIGYWGPLIIKRK